MSQETTYQLEEKENRINYKDDLDTRGFGSGHDECDNVRKLSPPTTQLDAEFQKRAGKLFIYTQCFHSDLFSYDFDFHGQIAIAEQMVRSSLPINPHSV